MYLVFVVKSESENAAVFPGDQMTKRGLECSRPSSADLKSDALLYPFRRVDAFRRFADAARQELPK